MNFEYTSINKVFNADDDLIKEIAMNNNIVCTAIKKTSISCDKDFEVYINNKKVLIKKDFGFETSYDDPAIKSFKIATDNVSIYAIITYMARGVE